MKVTLITPTGGRPQCFSILERLIKAQTRQPDTWIVIDDCVPHTVCTLNQTYIRGPKLWYPGMNTQKENMLLGLKYIKEGAVFIIEDDDYYAPDYIETMVGLLEHSYIAGIGESKYYSVQYGGHIVLQNFAHASLSQTAFRSSLLEVAREATLSDNFYIDIELWKICRENNVPWTLLHNTSLGVGMKGLPGRLGLTPSHTSKQYFIDSGHKILREWLGKDVAYYVPYLRNFKLRDNPGITTRNV
jgi:glycosyltransferase involved in cell wall biosynthesis